MSARVEQPDVHLRLGKFRGLQIQEHGLCVILAHTQTRIMGDTKAKVTAREALVGSLPEPGDRLRIVPGEDKVFAQAELCPGIVCGRVGSQGCQRILVAVVRILGKTQCIAHPLLRAGRCIVGESRRRHCENHPGGDQCNEPGHASPPRTTIASITE